MLITLSMLLPKLGLDVRKSWISFVSALNAQLGWGKLRGRGNSF
jgi:hypothetical protein